MKAIEPTVAQWHAQFVRQARWTQAMRSNLYRRANLRRARRVLDVGCGTGVITRELADRARGEVIGLDLDPKMIAYARVQGGRASYREGDALDLPYPDGHFDVVLCHYVLLWVTDPACALGEMGRVARPGGAVLICAEPDYGGRMDWPELPVWQWQVEGLRRQGANPLIGRRLRQVTVAAGLRADVGVYPMYWGADAVGEDLDAEWTWLQYDVGSAVEPVVFAQARAQAEAAVDAGTRLVYVPTFYAIAKR